MRNIILHTTVESETGDEGLRSVTVLGHAFDVARVRVTVRGAAGAVERVVDVDPRNRFVAAFDRADELRAAGLACGGRVRAEAADAERPEDCYASVQTALRG